MGETKENCREQAQQLSEFMQLNENRASTYQLLSRLFRVEVDEAFLESLKAIRFPAKTENANVTTGYRLIATYLSGTWENSLTELAVDYVRVFIGHGLDAYSAAYPYESVYTSEKRLMMQDARDEVLMIYRSAGLDKQSSWKEGEDHLALELEYMQILCDRTGNALKNKDVAKAYDLLQSQKNFLEDHLVSWVPMMTADVKRFAKTDFYKGLAYLVEGFLDVDLELLTEILAEDELGEED